MEEWSNTSHSFSRPRSAVRQQLILIGGNVQRGKEDIVSTCSRSVVYFNYFLINLNVAVQLHHVTLRRFWICRLKQNVTRAGRWPPAQNNKTFLLLCCAASVFQVVKLWLFSLAAGAYHIFCREVKAFFTLAWNLSNTTTWRCRFRSHQSCTDLHFHSSPVQSSLSCSIVNVPGSYSIYRDV